MHNCILSSLSRGSLFCYYFVCAYLIDTGALYLPGSALFCVYHKLQCINCEIVIHYEIYIFFPLCLNMYSMPD